MDSYELLEVLPSDHQNAPSETRYELSDLDQTITGIHNPAAIIYEVPSSIDNATFSKGIESGLSHALSQIPVAAGTIHRDQKTNRYFVRRRNVSTVRLGIRHMERDESFPSFKTLKADNFPLRIITDSRPKLFTAGSEPSDLPLGVRIEDGCPVSYFQVNYIRGGIILTSAIHHLCADAMSIDAIFLTWAASTKAAIEGSAIPTYIPNFDRTYFNATAKPDADELEALKLRVKGLKLVDLKQQTSMEPTPPLTPPKQQPQIADQMFHFPESSVKRLKKTCWPKEPGAYVSTYDCITALMWRAITRARIPYHKWDTATTKTMVLSAFNVRDKFGPVVTGAYFGNGITSALTDPLTVGQVIGAEGLPRAAYTIRQCILDVKETSVPDILKLRLGLEGTHKVKVGADFHFGTDIAATSLSSMKVFQKYDFGFGLPQALRAPSLPCDGIIAVFPMCPWRGNDEGAEVHVGLEQSCLERLRKDPELLTYCEPRGL